MKAYRLDQRERIVQAVERGMSQPEAAAPAPADAPPSGPTSTPPCSTAAFPRADADGGAGGGDGQLQCPHSRSRPRDHPGSGMLTGLPTCLLAGLLADHGGGPHGEDAGAPGGEADAARVGGGDRRGGESGDSAGCRRMVPPLRIPSHGPLPMSSALDRVSVHRTQATANVTNVATQHAARSTRYAKKSRSSSQRCACAASMLNSTPMPGRSQTSMKLSLTMGLGNPSTMSYHQSGLPVGYSKAM